MQLRSVLPCRMLPTTLTDELIDRACAGDPQAFGALARIVDPDLRGVAWAVLRNSHQVDDVMQTVYEKAFRQINTFNRQSRITTWLHSIAYRAAIDMVRYESRRRHEDLTGIEQDSAAAARATPVGDTVEIKLEFIQVMQQMDPETRTLLMLTAGFGHSYDEVADITGISRGTVASRVARAKTKLRNEAERDETI